MNKPIVIFDGCCELCSSSVQFIKERDPGDHFQFVPMQSKSGADLLCRCGLAPQTISSFVLIDKERCITGSDAALAIARNLRGFWKFFTAFRIIPRRIRDWPYNAISRNRHRFFGKGDTCPLPFDENQRRSVP